MKEVYKKIEKQSQEIEFLKIDLCNFQTTGIIKMEMVGQKNLKLSVFDGKISWNIYKTLR